MSALGRARAASDLLDRLVIRFCVLCVLVMLSISFIGFFYMMSTGRALAWTYSLARLFIPWIGMLSITVAFKAGEHVAMGVIVDRLPPRLAAACRWCSVALVALFAALLVWFGIDLFIHSTQYFMVSDQIQVHHRWVVACVPATGIVLLLHLVSGTPLLIAAVPIDEVVDEAVAEARRREAAGAGGRAG